MAAGSHACAVSRLYFAAKAPIAGQVKTRLGAAIGAEAAAALYAAFLADLAARFEEAEPAVGWYLPEGAWPHLLPILGPGNPLRVQRGADWAARQSNLFRDCAVAREGKVVLAATDSPQIRPARIEAAFTALDRNDLVLGPTLDGGYYLVGMGGFHDVFSCVDMGTASALGQVLARASSLNLSVALLDAEFDVDTAADLALLQAAVESRDDLWATAAILAGLRCRATV
ncbi:MAG: TIGR04282 family arsenosugar biosynthesis glycosyltransferase [Candidatus Dormibacterales bacterium]